MRTVTLEFLRHGPPHNQLLSPLTRYMALCGNHPGETVELPFMHAQFLKQLRSLRYKGGDAVTRDLELEGTARQMGKILGEIPGLIAELAQHKCEREEMTHLRLVLSANELALLPFELADAPNGFPGAGQPLALQAQARICITREARRVSHEEQDWTSKPPKILFAAASPGGVGEVPFKPHALALRQVIEPWLRHFDDKKDRNADIKQHLRILPRASVKSLQEVCRSGEITHVHLLAHGIPYKKGEDRRYGLALHDSDDPGKKDVVDGGRLATLLRTPEDRVGAGLTRPLAVTLASCDSGNTGSVVGAGASVAHALHQAGIPFVVASQFPLSFAGSIEMIKVLYEGLLWGEDPRTLIDAVRRGVKARVPHAHDWASIVAYASLPKDMERQLARLQVRQSRRSIEAALNHADEATRSSQGLAGTGDGSSSASAPQEKRQEKIDDVKDSLKKLNDAKKRLRATLESQENPREQSRINGLLATTEKRQAEVLLGLNSLLGSTMKEQTPRDCLERSLGYYRDAYENDRSQNWALVQQLALTAVCEGGERVSRDDWELARLLSKQDLEGADLQRQAWAHQNLMELYMLTLLMPDGSALIDDGTAQERAKAHVASLVRIKSRDPQEARRFLGTVDVNHVTARTVARYLGVYEHDSAPLKELADQLLDQLKPQLQPSPGTGGSGAMTP